MANSKYINELIERDKAKPMGRYFWKTEEYKNDPPADICGVCGRVLGESWTFCPTCGNRIDTENYKIGAEK